MSITLKDPQTTLDILDTEAMTWYIRDHIQVITAHTEECRDSAGVSISIVAPPFIQFFDAIHNRVAVSVDSDLQRGQRHPEGRDAFPAHRAPDSEALKACLRFPRLPGDQHPQLPEILRYRDIQGQ